MQLTKPVLLVGMMGSGKSAAGSRLAFQLGLPFIDADHALIAREHKSIAQIFEEYGEPEFRRREKTILAELINGPPQVIAGGGGAVLNAETRSLMREKTHSIWLQADIEALTRRVARDKNRPLLQNADPRHTLETLLAARAAYYAEAEFHIDTSGKTLDEVVGACVRKLKGLEDK